MAQEVRLMGATYSDVPSVLLPDSSNVLHAFTDTSDADAAAADIALGKTAYAGGLKITGSAPLLGETAAEPDAGGDILAGITTQYYYTIRAKDLVQGQWSYTTPASTPTTRARSRDFVYVTAGSTITYVNATYDCYFQVYASKTATSPSQTIGWKTDAGGTINITVSGYLTFVIRNHYNTSANVNPSSWDGSVVITTATVHNGVTFTWNGSDVCTVTGTSASSGAVCSLISAQALPSAVTVGKKLYAKCVTDSAKVRLRILFKDSGGTNIQPIPYFEEDGIVTVPEGAVSWTVQIHCAGSTSFTTPVTIGGIRLFALKKIADAGTMLTGDIYVRDY